MSELERILTPYVSPSVAPVVIFRESQLDSRLVCRFIHDAALRSALRVGVRRGRRFALVYAPKDW